MRWSHRKEKRYRVMGIKVVFGVERGCRELGSWGKGWHWGKWEG